MIASAQALAGQNIAFRLDGERGFIHDRAAAKTVLLNEAASAEASHAVCLVSGKVEPIARLHARIKGVGEKLAPLVSFNEEAFVSFGKSQGLNAPVSEAAAFAYATALNGLIAAQNGIDEKGRPHWSNRIRLGEDAVVFWAETPAAEAVVRNVFDPPPPDDETESAEVRTIMQRLERGEPLRDAAPDVDEATRVYVLGLSPNAARLSVRFWEDKTLGELA